MTILLICLANVSWGQEDVILSIEPLSADVGETVLISVKTKVQGTVDIDNLPSCFVHGHDISGEMETDINHQTGTITTYYRLSRTGAFAKAGTYTIGPAFVKKGNKTYQSNEVTITIGNKMQMTSSEVTAEQLRDPAFGIIQTNKTTIYEGEPLVVGAKVYAHFNPTYLDNYLPYSMKGAIDKHPVGNSAVTQTMRETFRGVEMFSFEYDKNVIFPVGTGDFKVNSYSMTVYEGYRNFSLTSTSADITIKPLPADPPADFIGAVGFFQLEREIEANDLKQGDVFKMRIIVSGAGNLQNILEPKPELPKGFIIYGDPQIEDNFVYNSKGTEGEITYEYNIQVSQFGDLAVPPTSISYFDIAEEKYITISSEEFSLDVKKNKNFVVEEPEDIAVENLEEIDMLSGLRKSSIQENGDAFFGSSSFWLSMGAPLMTALLFIFFSKRREQSEDKIILRQTIRKKDQELSDNLAQTKVLLASGDSNGFYSKVEATLKSAMEIKMQVSEEQMVSRQAMFDFLEKSNNDSLLRRFKELLTKCDQFRYGFDSNETADQSVLKDLESILNDLNI